MYERYEPVPERHEMVLETTHSSGAEEWYCPTCGRRMLVNWEPKFKKIVLEAGDDSASHAGSKGGLQMGSLQIAPVDDATSQEEPETLVEDPRLAPWVAWLEEVDFDSLWNAEV